MRFRATIRLSGKSATGIEVPPQPGAAHRRRIDKALQMLRGS